VKLQSAFQETARLFKTGMMVLLFAVLVLGANTAYPQNNDDEEQARKKYEFELAKSWSFGWENYKNKQYERATKHFWKLVKIDTIQKFPRVYRYLGDSYFKLNQPDSAQLVFEMGAKKHPEDPHLHRMLGYLLLQREQIAEAIDEYEKVMELEPESVEDLKQLAALYVRADRVNDGIATYERILEIDPDNVEAQKNLSELLRTTGDIEGVIAAKLKVAEQDSQNAQVRFDLGKLYFDQGEYEKAIMWFNELLQLSPTDIQAMEYIGQSYQRLEQYGKAIGQFKKILEIEPKNKRVMCEISRCYTELDNFASARSYALRALGVDKAYGLGWIVLGEAYEASAERCDIGDGTLGYDDKLVYELAYQKYARAARDLEFKGDAESKINYLKPLLPTNEDVFMHSTDKRPATSCYEWIPDSEFDNGFWNNLNQRLGK